MAPQTKSVSTHLVSPIFAKDTLINGRPVTIDCVRVAGQTYSITGGLFKVLQLEDEWFEDIVEPDAVIESLRQQSQITVDIFNFLQRVPETVPQYPYHHEWESFAVLPIDTYDRWWKQIESATRNKVRKSRKLGVEVRVCEFDDEFVRGMTNIFNESPIRQGRPFWHYGKDFETVKRQFSRYLFREQLIGAYYGDELVGFTMLANGGEFGDIGQIISKIEHRDKAVTNAMMAKCVELCEKRHWKYLVYAKWMDSSLGDFKRQSGFLEMKLPRYFVPLTLRGRLVLQLSLHRGLRRLLPEKLKQRLKHARKSWYERLTPGDTNRAPRLT